MSFWSLVGNSVRTIIESLARFANDFLYAFFNTVWATTYYVAYWRNWPFAALIIFAFLIDMVRLDRQLCERIWSRLFSLRVPLGGAFAIAAVGYVTFIIRFDVSDFSFGAPHLHYEQAKLYTTALRAQLVYAVETIGICIGFVALVVYSIRQSAGATVFERRPKKKKLRFQELLTLWILLVFLGLVLMARVFDLGQSSTTFNRHYDPGSNLPKLFMYFASPFFLAVGAKYWLLIVYLIRAKDRNDHHQTC